MNKNTAIALSAILTVAVLTLLILKFAGPSANARTFEQCAAEGNPIMESYPRQCRFPDGTLTVELIDGDSSSQAQANIVVTEPVENDEVENPLTISGEARVFENSFAYRILDADGNILVEGHDMAEAPDIGQFGPFDIEVSYAIPSTEEGTVEVFEYSAKDGSEINKVVIPVKFAPSDKTTVKIFLSHETADPNASCEEVYPVDRFVPKTTTVAKAALEELLRGPTTVEQDEAMFTSIPQGIKLVSLVVNDGTARAVFSRGLSTVAGSCTVQAIRRQIEQTLLQFNSIDSVEIAIEGVPDDEVLQP